MLGDRCPRPVGPRILPVVSLLIALVARPASGQDVDPLLADFEARDCLAAERGALEASLDRIDARHLEEVERRGFKRAWRQLRRPLEASSAEGRALVESWLDSPERARRLFFCDDDLPLPRDGLDSIDFADVALDHLYGRWWAEERWLRGADGDREGAASRLVETRRALLWRFDAMYDNREPSVAAARGELVERLAAFEAEHLEPWSLGLDAEGTDVHFEPDPIELGLDVDGASFERAMKTLPIVGNFVAWIEALTPKPPSMAPPRPYADLDYEPGVRQPLFADGGLRLGNVAVEPAPVAQTSASGGGGSTDLVSGKIPDPRDVVEAMRIEEGWARQRRALRREIRGEKQRLAQLESGLERDDLAPTELDRLARDVERSRRRLSRLSEDTRRKMIEVQETEASRPWVTDMLRGRAKRTAVDGLDRSDRRALATSADAKEVVEQTVERGATSPGTGPRGDGHGGGYSGPPRPTGTTVASTSASAGPGPIDAGRQDALPDGLDVGELDLPEGAVTWQGFLPLPDPAWDPSLVAEVRAAHPELDDVDVRILLGLIDRAADLGGRRDAVATLVRSLLDANGRLALRGGESRLSDLLRTGLPEGAQPEVVFVLVLEAGSPTQ
jgi:hypothetical protein